MIFSSMKFQLRFRFCRHLQNRSYLCDILRLTLVPGLVLTGLGVCFLKYYLESRRALVAAAMKMLARRSCFGNA